MDVKGMLEAAHTAVNAYFLLRKLLEEEARIWYHAQHRAFIETVRLPAPRSPTRLVISLVRQRSGHTWNQASNRRRKANITPSDLQS